MTAISDTVATLYKHIGRRVVAAKEHTELHLLAILPLVLEIFVRLSVLNRGTADTLFALRGNLEGEYTDDGLPAQSIIDVGLPPISARDEGKIRTTLWQLVQDLNARGYSPEDIATACFLSATKNAERSGGKVIRFGIIKRAIDSLKWEPVFQNGRPPLETYLLSLPENYAEYKGGVDISVDVGAALDDQFSNWGPSVVEMVESVFQNKDFLEQLAAACFALQQDVHKKFKVDMWRCDDYLLAAVTEQAMSPPLELDFPDRLLEAFGAVNGMINSNLDESDRQAREAKSKTDELLATMRANAAGVWVLTLLAKMRAKNKLRNSHMRSIWLMLGTIQAEELVEPAKMFTGTFLDGISAGTLDLDNWPRVNHRGLFLASLIRPKSIIRSPIENPVST
jgi:hypothetical protein